MSITEYLMIPARLLFAFACLSLLTFHHTLNAKDGRVVVIDRPERYPIIFIEQNNKIHHFEANKEGNVLENKDLGVRLTISEKLRTKSIEQWLRKELFLQHVKVTSFMLVTPAYFDLNSYIIRNDASAAIDRVINLLVIYTKATVTIEAYADIRGTEHDNLELSRKRGNTVAQYIQAAGIDKNRLHLSIKGERDLIKTCTRNCPELYYQVSRSVDFTFNIPE